MCRSIWRTMRFPFVPFSSLHRLKATIFCLKTHACFAVHSIHAVHVVWCKDVAWVGDWFFWWYRPFVLLYCSLNSTINQCPVFACGKKGILFVFFPDFSLTRACYRLFVCEVDGVNWVLGKWCFLVFVDMKMSPFCNFELFPLPPPLSQFSIQFRRSSSDFGCSKQYRGDAN